MTAPPGPPEPPLPEPPMPEPLAPVPDCPLCVRFAAFRAENRTRHPEFHNAPVPAFGGTGARLLVVGLAPGLKGANRTGRPFTGDYAGDLLYRTLAKFGFARGRYARHAEDGLQLVGCRVSNAVRCVPPQNKPSAAEVATCRRFLRAEIAALARLRAVLALGTVAHGAVLAACDQPKSRYRFAHGALHALPSGLLLADSYHCSRLNTNTGRLTEQMFEAVFAALMPRLAERAS